MAVASKISKYSDACNKINKELQSCEGRITKILKNHAIDQNLIQTRKKMTKCNLFGQSTLPPTRTQADDAAFPLGSGNGKNKSLCF